MSGDAVGGIFVGGASRRMGGAPKGLLRSPGGGTLVERARTALAGAGVDDVVLVGRHPAYDGLGLAGVDDVVAGIGPLGGLLALLRHAGSKRAVALACDMPYVSSAFIGRLLAAPPAPVVAPRRTGWWEPLCARYEPAVIRYVAEAQVDAGEHSLQRLLDRAGAEALQPADTDAQELRDWDTPEDVDG